VTFGSDCTVWDEKLERFCGDTAVFVRRDGRTNELVGVICERHRRAGDQAFAFGVARAPHSTRDREHRFTRSGAA
jgi:hypothetical protein